MKPKTVFHLALVVALMPSLPGCILSHNIVDCANKADIDIFNPSAVYQKKDPNSLALEGLKQDHNHTQQHIYVIIPQEILLYYTNGNFSLENVKDLRNHIDTTELKHSRHLPSGYVKIADFQKNDVWIEIVAHHPNAYLVMFLPFTVIVDVVGCPYEIVYTMHHSEGW